MYAQQNTRNGDSFHLDERLQPDRKAELLREKAEIEKRLRAINNALTLYGGRMPDQET